MKQFLLDGQQAKLTQASLETLAVIAFLVVIEFSGPFIAEKRFLATPWNAEHIAERYATLMVITLGEGVVGTIAGRAIYDGSLDFAAAQKLADELGA